MHDGAVEGVSILLMVVAISEVSAISPKLELNAG